MGGGGIFRHYFLFFLVFLCQIALLSLSPHRRGGRTEGEREHDETNEKKQHQSIDGPSTNQKNSILCRNTKYLLQTQQTT